VKLVDVALATRHGKERQLRAAFSDVLGWNISVAAIDTDSFGTFTGDVPRSMSPRETALAKARRGAEALGLARGLGSEGTIGPHPGIPFVTAAHEIIAFVDRDEGFELVESVVSTDVLAVSEPWTPELSLEELGGRAGLPAHGLIVRTVGSSLAKIHKGLTTLEGLRQAIAECQSSDPGAQIQVESDFRAMMSPTRQAVIETCAWKLANRLARLCPECSCPGWGLVGYEYGATCGGCGAPSSDVASADIEGCARCDYRVVAPRPVVQVNPAQCDVCNP
jgi:hypothetical protein